MKLLLIFICLMFMVPSKSQASSMNNQKLAINRKYRKFIEGSMNPQIDPCEDFYQYACGKWEEYHKEAGDKYSEMLGMASHQANKELARYLKSIHLEDKPMFVKNVVAFFRSCVAVEEFDHLRYVKWMKENANLTWPLPGTARRKTDKFDWVHTLGVMRRYGLNGVLIEEDMVPTPDNPAKLIMTLNKPGNGSSFEAMTYENLNALIESMSVTLTSISVQTLWEEISDIEARLIELSDMEDNADVMVIRVNDLTVPWLQQYVATILNQTSLDPNMELNIPNMAYMKALEDLVKEFKEYHICKYLGLRFLWQLHQYSPSEFIPLDCVKSVQQLLPLAMNWIYEQNHPEIREITPEIYDIFNNIVHQFNSTLVANKMEFDKAAFEYVQTKLNSIQLKVGNVPVVESGAFLESFYANLTLYSSDFYGNHLKLFKFGFQALHSAIPNTLTTNIREYVYLETPTDGGNASPFYVPWQQIVVVPFVALRQPVFHSDYDDVFKYSALGSAIGHEIFHAFDYTGLKIDAMGKENTQEYLKVLENSVFAKNYECLWDLYSPVMDEKVADISGLRYTYEAFVARFPEAFTKTRLIHGLEMNMTKLFFLNFAQYYCDTNTDPNAATEHGLASSRVNNALSHLSAFSEAYKCSNQSLMHPAEMCQLWS